MQATSATLLGRLGCRSQNLEVDDDAAWRQLIDIYSPVIIGWLKLFRVDRTDQAEVLQDVLLILIRKLGTFERQREGSFRKFLRSTTFNCVRDYRRKLNRVGRGQGGSGCIDQLNALPDNHVCGSGQNLDDQELLASLLQRVEPEFTGKTWKAFQLVAIENYTVSEAATKLDMSSNGVTIAKSRVLKRLRETAETCSLER